MSSLTIVTRRAQDGPRYLVRYRLGGRSYPVVHAGSFKTLKEAKARRDSSLVSWQPDATPPRRYVPSQRLLRSS